MKTLPLQLVTLNLENGEQGVFVGWPLVDEGSPALSNQVQDIWFSDVQEVPEKLTVAQLIELVRGQLCRP